MTDFLERFGAELTAAEARLSRDFQRRHMRRRWPRRRAALLVFAALAVSVPAVATRPWTPILGDSAHDDTPAGISLTRPPAAQLDQLSILRRPQNEADRGPAAQRLLTAVGAEYKGVRLNSIRLLTSADGYHALLVPSEAHGLSAHGGYEVPDDLCVQALQGSFCDPIKGLPTSNFLGSFGDDTWVGLVPDGVATVVLLLEDGSELRSRVRENFFSISGLPRSATSGARGFKVRWLDAQGRRVGPEGALGG